MTDTVFGTVVTPYDLEIAAMESLQRWLPTYLGFRERHLGLQPGTLAEIAQWTQSNEFQRLQDDRTPAVILVSTGTTQPPTRKGDGRYDAWFALGVGIVVNAETREASERLAKDVYAPAAMLALIQHADLDGFAGGLRLVDISFRDAPADYLPVGCVAQVSCEVLVYGIGDAYAGPLEPAPDPHIAPDDFPTVTSTHVSTSRRSLT